MTALQNYYIKLDEVTKDIYKVETVKKNKKELLKNDIFKGVYAHLLDVIPANTTVELLANINCYSIVWEYLRNNCGEVDGLMNEFLSTLCNDIIDPFNNDSKLNRLRALNSIIYLLTVE